MDETILLFEVGFLGLDTIGVFDGVFDRSNAIPSG
jgi:hypothetical protein